MHIITKNFRNLFLFLSLFIFSLIFSFSLMAKTATITFSYPGTVADVTGYKIYYSVNTITTGSYNGTGLSSDSPITIALGNVSALSGQDYSITIPSLVDGSVYYFAMSALTAGGESAKSNEVNSKMPGTPANFRIISMLIQKMIDSGVTKSNTVEKSLNIVLADCQEIIAGKKISPALSKVFIDLRKLDEKSELQLKSKSDLELAKDILEGSTQVNVTGNIIQQKKFL